MGTLLIISCLVCVALIYLVIVFAVGSIVHHNAVTRCNRGWCWCDELNQNAHYISAAIIALVWPIYWLFRLGRWLSNFSYPKWKEARRSAKAERELETLRLAHAKATLLRKEELARLEHARQMAIRNQALLDEQTGISKARRLLHHSTNQEG